MNMHHGDSNHDQRRHGHDDHRPWWLKVLGVLAALVIAVTCLGWIVTELWNWLMTALFGLGVITFWQALGLFVLGRLLIGGLRGFGGHRGFRQHRRMHERWEQMSPAERESFSRGLKRHCPWESTDGKGPAPDAPRDTLEKP